MREVEIVRKTDVDIRRGQGKSRSGRRVVRNGQAIAVARRVDTSVRGEETLEGAGPYADKRVSPIDDGRAIKPGMGKLEAALKRGFDATLAGLLLVLFSPLYLLCYIMVKREDGGDAIYKQERIGKDGKPFHIYKFRSMRLDAEAMGPQLYNEGNDPRLTKVGKFLREHHLDELPQLWNVFTGDMAFIGPRPERKYYIDQIMERDARYRYLYQIRPGVTSYATLYNGYTDTLDKMVTRLHYDLYYMEHSSWLMDAKILWLTFYGIVGGKKF